MDSSTTRPRPGRFPIIVIGAALALATQAVLQPGPLAGQWSPCDGLDRPCVALVLAGGGAKGGAHVGVLKVLEEFHVPVDMIVGTSMGAVVGGIYATGYSASEVEAAMAAVDWDEVFTGQPPRVYRSIRRKEEQRDLSIDFEFGLKGMTPSFPRGLLPDQNLNFLLAELTSSVAHVGSFDDLPIPFRAIAADLLTGEAILLSDRSLADGIRASLSLPGIFPPVQRDGRLLVDGGIAMNFPVEIAKDWGADIVIGVEVPSAPTTQEDLNSALAVTVQLTNLLQEPPQARSRILLGADDIHMVTNLRDLTTMEFDRVGEALVYGEEVAREHGDRLAEISLDDQAWASHIAARNRPDPTPVLLDFIRVAGSDQLREEVVLARLNLRPGDPLDHEVLKQDLARLYGLGWYERVDYRLVEVGGQTGLEIVLEDKPWGPRYLRSGLRLSDDLSGQSSYRITLSYLAGPVNRSGGELRVTGTLGDPLSALVDFYQPLDARSRFFLSAAADLVRFSDSPGVQTSGELVLQRGKSRSARLGAGFNLGSSVEVRSRVRVQSVSGTEISDAGELADLDVVEFGLDTRIIIDRLDHPFFPTRGSELVALWVSGTESGFGDVGFHQLGVRGSVGRPAGRHAFRVSGEVGWSFGTEVPSYREFRLGGLGRISGLGSGLLVGDYLGLATLRYDLTLLEWPSYTLFRSIKLGGTVEAGNIWESQEQVTLSDPLVGGSAFLGIDSKFGPLVLAFGVSSGGETSWYLSLGAIR